MLCRHLFALSALLYAGVAVAQRVPLGEGPGLYPRVVRITHDRDPARNGTVIASVTAFHDGKGEEQISRSSGEGAPFARVGTITGFDQGLCCGTLFELPSAIGSLPAGTLLWAGSSGGNKTSPDPMEIRIYRSADQGTTWTYLSRCAQATAPHNSPKSGLWEPEFAVAANGQLVCYYSDETVPDRSQVLRRVASGDGLHWSAPVDVVSSSDPADRPGMAVVRKTGAGLYLMSYEICGPAHHCQAFIRTSPDGLDWGDPKDPGKRIETADGRWFTHAPTIAWAMTPDAPGGRTFAIGQLVEDAHGIAKGNGRVLFYTDSADSAGPWKTMPAPAPIATPPSVGEVCRNYSSPLLPSPDGRTLLGIATDQDAPDSRRCRPFVGRASATVVTR